jgi:anti-sigma regulatory factor (Ser/Thr protein kinase)
VLASVLVIPGRPEHVLAARAFTSLVLSVHGIDDDGVAGLLVTELAANSLQHSDSGKPGGTVTVTVTVAPGTVVAEVADDGGDGEPALRGPAGEEAERGRGLQLVEALSDGWGYSRAGGRLVTWFSLQTGMPS